MKNLITLAMLTLTIGVFAQTENQKHERTRERKHTTEIKVDSEGTKKDGFKHDKKGSHFKKSNHPFAGLDLSETQKEQLKALKGERKSKGELAQNTKPTKEEIQARRMEREQKIKSILTPEQYAKFSEQKENRMKKQ